jgi:hypothetical protein
MYFHPQCYLQHILLILSKRDAQMTASSITVKPLPMAIPSQQKTLAQWRCAGKTGRKQKSALPHIFETKREIS